MLNEDLKQVIKEELGISDKVREYSKAFFKDMLSEIEKTDDVVKTEVMVKKTCPLSFFIGNIKISSTIVYRNFLSKDYNKLYTDPHVTDGSSFCLSKNVYLCIINVYAVCGVLDRVAAMETIQHEIEHIYQQIMMNDSFGGDLLYTKIKTDMFSGDPNREKVGNLLYHSLKPEQEGFSNGLYAFLMDSMEPYSEELLMDSEAWRIYTSMKETFNELKDSDEMKKIFSEYYEEYGITLNGIEREINNFLHRIGRVAIKAKQDKAKQGWR